MEALAVARCARGIVKVLGEFAEDLETAAREADRILETEPIARVDEGRRLGPRQRAILELPGLADDRGMKTAEVATSIDYEVPNTHMTLKALAGAGLIELIPGSAPQRWRLAARYRPTADPYMRIAAHVRRGEWATYGDISIAHRGDTRAARAVGRVAATLPTFPNPHRVLLEGGIIPDGWRGSEISGPEECRRRLEAEGVKFTDDGRAAPAFRVTWDLLVDRYDGHDLTS